MANLRRRFGTALALALLCAARAGAQVPTTEQLQQDVTFLEQKLPEVHLGFARIVPAEEWKARCETTRQAIARLSGPARVLKLAELVASLQVAHTRLDAGNAGFRHLPIRFAAFADGLTVVAAADEHTVLGGARVLAVGRKPEKEVVQRLGALEPSENEYWRRLMLGDWSSIADAYAAAGLSDSASQVAFTFRLKSGEKVTRALLSTPTSPTMKPPPEAANIPTFMRRTALPYKIVTCPEARALVLDYRRCAEDPQRSMVVVAEEFWKTFDAGDYRYAVVDLRRNGGGNSEVLRPFINSLKARPDIAAQKRLYAFITHQTFSSGMMNAVHLRQAGAILMGEPTGGSPNSYGELKFLELPNSKLRVSYCTKYFRLERDAAATTVMPDVKVELNWADIAAGRDAWLERLRRPDNLSDRAPLP